MEITQTTATELSAQPEKKRASVRNSDINRGPQAA